MHTGEPPAAERATRTTTTVRVALDPALVLRVLLAISLALIAVDVAIQVIADLAAPGFPGWETAAIILDADQEASLPTWWGIVLLLTAAIVSALAALSAERAERRYFWSLALIFLLLSADEQAMIHEHAIVPLRDRFGFGGILFYAWVVPALVAIAALTVIYARFVFRQPPPVRNLLILSAALFVSGALGLEMLGGWWTENRSNTDLTYQMITSVEELLEYIGASLYIFALLRLLQARQAALRITTTV